MCVKSCCFSTFLSKVSFQVCVNHEVYEAAAATGFFFV